MVKEIGHLAFTCKDLSTSVAFYRNILGFRHKFDITYGDILVHEKAVANAEGKSVDPALIDQLTPIKDKVWISYFEIKDRQYIELFDAGKATEIHIPDFKALNYNHLALVVDDIHAACEALKAKDVPIDTPPTLGMDYTWQMWVHDPDGNRIEFMEYTDRSWQIAGKN